MEDAFEIIEDNRRQTKEAEDENRGLLRELLEQLGTQKLIVEQEDIDVNISEPQEVDGPIIEDYFCEREVSEEPASYQKPHPLAVEEENLAKDTSRSESPEFSEAEAENTSTTDVSPEFERFSNNFTGAFLRSQNLSASMMLTAPLTDLAKPIALVRRNSAPILHRRRETGNFSRDSERCSLLSPNKPDRSKSTPVQSPSMTPQEAGEILEHTLSLPSNGLNLFELNSAGEEDTTSNIPTCSGNTENELSTTFDEKSTMGDVESVKHTIEKALEDVGSSIAKVEYRVCSSAPVDIPPFSSFDSKPIKLSENFLTVVSLTSLSIYPVFHEKKLLYLKLTDLVFAVILTTIVFWSYRELEMQRLRTNIANCQCEHSVLNSTQQHSPLSESYID